MTITTVKKLYRTCDKMRVQLDELEEVMGRGAQAATHYTDTLAFEVMEIIDHLRMGQLVHDSTKVDIVSVENYEFWLTMVLDAEIDPYTESKLKQKFTVESDGEKQLISVFIKLD
jgi:hypothetical protein